MQPQIITGGFPQIDPRLMTLEMMCKASEILSNIAGHINLSAKEEDGTKTWSPFVTNLIRFLNTQSEKL